ncbi:anaerobic benzoate catabolism transcriptional regulator [Klebsiella quasipneumoniae]|nr:anaerobic benzoate catabolism transcriptional regulator [Klebsiella quasipneumoniae]
MTQPISVIAKSLVRERARTGLSLAEVARRAGIAKSTLSQLESGNGNPSLETLWSLCVALDIPFARLLEPQVNKTQVIRRGEGTKVVAEQANYQAILLAACLPGARRDIYLLLTQPGADRISHPHPPPLGGTYYRDPGAGAGRADVGAGRARRGRLYLLSGGSGACVSGPGAGYAGPADR